MTKDEALRLALGALEKISRTQYHIETPPIESLEERMRRIADQAITTIKAALEAKDEPVAKAIAEQAYESGYSTGFMDGAIKAQEAKDGCQCPACKVAPHASDCAVHNEPAYPAGECNCGAKGEPVAWVYPEFWQHLENLNCGTAYRLSGIGRQPLYSAPQKQPPVIDKSVARRIATQLGWEPPRTPITDDDIRQANHHMVCGAYDYSFKQGVRWAEKVHGIKWEWEK